MDQQPFSGLLISIHGSTAEPLTPYSSLVPSNQIPMQPRLQSFAFLFSACISASCVTGQIATFSDGDFTGWAHSDYVRSAFPPSVPTAGSQATVSISTNGNPGQCADALNVVTTNASVLSVYVSNTALFDPSLQGAVGRVALSIEANVLVSPFAGGQGIGFALTQNGVDYVQSVAVTGTSSSWVPIASGAVLPTFARADGLPGAPNLSQAGDVVRWGFYVSNSTCFNCGGYSTRALYDNWSIDVFAAPYLGSNGGLALQSAIGVTSPPSAAGIKTAVGGDLMTIDLSAAQAALVGAPFILGASVVSTGQVPAPGPLLWLDLSNLVILQNGFSPVGGFAHVLGPFGNRSTYQLPPGLSGWSVFLQSACVAPGVGFVLSDAHEVQVL